jgi:hypothetical protein
MRPITLLPLLAVLAFAVFAGGLCCGFVAGVASGYRVRKRLHETIADLTARLTKHEGKPHTPITVSYSPGVPRNLMLMLNPSSLSDLVIKHWRDQSAGPESNDELLAGLDEDQSTPN